MLFIWQKVILLIAFNLNSYPKWMPQKMVKKRRFSTQKVILPSISLTFKLAFFVWKFVQSQTLSRVSWLLYKKCAHNMLMKLTPNQNWGFFSYRIEWMSEWRQINSNNSGNRKRLNRAISQFNSMQFNLFPRSQMHVQQKYLYLWNTAMLGNLHDIIQK